MASAVAVTLPCLYTKHKVKKRKAWSDGKLVVSASGNCVLYDANSATKITAGVSIDAVLLRGEELRQVMSGSEIEIEMEHHLVALESLPMETSIAVPSHSPAATVRVPVPRRAQHDDVDNCATTLAHSRGDTAKQQKQAHPATPWSAMRKTVAAPVAAAPSLAAACVRSELARPFKPPAVRPPSGAAVTSASVTAALSSSIASISERYRGQYGGVGAAAEAGGGKEAANVYDKRYEGVAGSAGNGRYAVSSDEIDDMWADEEALEQRQGLQLPPVASEATRASSPSHFPGAVTAAAHLQFASPKAVSGGVEEEADVWGCAVGSPWDSGSGRAAAAPAGQMQDAEDIWDI